MTKAASSYSGVEPFGAWLTTGEIAEACCGRGGVPLTRKGVELLVKRLGIPNRPRQGRGGGREYEVLALPVHVRNALAGISEREDESGKSAACDVLVNPDCSGLSVEYALAANVSGAERRDGRLHILTLVLRWQAQRDCSLTAARRQFAEIWNDGRAEEFLTVPDWVRAAVGSELSVSCLRRWSLMQERGQIGELAGRYGRAKKSPIDRLGLGDIIVGLKMQQPHLSSGHIRDQLRARVGDRIALSQTGEAVPLPSCRAIARWWAAWRENNPKALALVTSPDAYRSKYAPAFGKNDEQISALNQLWEIDASPADILLKDGRYSIYACIDIYTRRVRILVTKTPRTSAALLLIKTCIEEWGVPDTIRTDNGSDFVSRTARLALDCLGIHHDISPPYTPEYKGSVERVIKTMQHGLMPLLDGFIGHNVTDRKKIEERKSFAQRLGEKEGGADIADLNRDGLQEACDWWAKEKYEVSIHSALGCSPAQKAQDYSGAVRTIDDLGLLALFLQPVDGDGVRTVQKSGVRIKNGIYIADWLEVGTQVFVRQNPHDQGRIHVFALDLITYLGEAVDPELVGASRIGIAKAAKARTNAQNKKIRATVRAMQREAMGRESLIEAAQSVRAEDSPNVVTFGKKPTVSHSTPKLEAGKAALGTTPPMLTDAEMATEMAAREQARREMSVAEAPVAFESDGQKYARWKRLNARALKGERIPENEARFYDTFQKTSAFRVHRELEDDEIIEAQTKGARA